jgi:hypothetical protein
MTPGKKSINTHRKFYGGIPTISISTAVATYKIFNLFSRILGLTNLLSISTFRRGRLQRGSKDLPPLKRKIISTFIFASNRSNC